MTEFSSATTADTTRAVPESSPADPRPTRRLAVLTCMDARIDVLAVLDLRLGDAHVLRNAGARVTDDVLRSLALSTHLLDVNALVVVQHTSCALAGVTNEALQGLTGADRPFLPIDDHAAALRDDIELVGGLSYLEPIQTITGFVYDLATGDVDEVVRWRRAH